MKLDIIIDKLTPCLVEVSTGKVLQTTFALVSKTDVSDLATKGWLFDWRDKELNKTNIYKLLIKGEKAIQGLIAVEVVRGAVYVHLTESAPHNRGKEKCYDGVGGHLFAIAIKLSLVNGFGGYIYFDAKNIELVEHYSEMFNANRVKTMVHEYRMEISEHNAQNIINE